MDPSPVEVGYTELALHPISRNVNTALREHLCPHINRLCVSTLQVQRKLNMDNLRKKLNGGKSIESQLVESRR